MRMDLALIIHFQNVKEGTVDQSMVSVKEFLRHPSTVLLPSWFVPLPEFRRPYSITRTMHKKYMPGGDWKAPGGFLHCHV